MLENLQNYAIILASGSPRRRELLKGLGVNFEVKTLPDIDESFPKHLVGEKIPQYISQNKAAAYCEKMKENELIITADTVVCLEGEVLGKPANEGEACAMLRQLSNQHHDVITGVTIMTQKEQISFASVTHVIFDILTEEEIQHYVKEFRPFDKAGAYGIQEWIGYMGVKAIEGSYFNVMGLPVQLLYKHLKAIKS